MRIRSSFTSYAVSIALSVAVAGCTGSGGNNNNKSKPPQKLLADVINEVQHDTSSIPLGSTPAARRLPPPAVSDDGEGMVPIPGAKGGAPTRGDGAVQGKLPKPQMPTATRSFEGVGKGFTGPQGTFNVQAAPPDTNGAVGPNHFVQTTNTDFAIFAKSGQVLYGPVQINTVFAGFGGPCETTNDGDPVVQYDQFADRWIISQFAI